MDSIYVPKMDITSLADSLGAALSGFSCFFVTLDSSRGRFHVQQQFLSPDMRAEGIDFWWQEEGLWLNGPELLKPYVIYKIIVPFSAAFIFQTGVTNALSPAFNDTTDRGEFSNQQNLAAEAEIRRLGAVAYVADGGGLQTVSNDKILLDATRRLGNDAGC